jgi:hypothetical protein
VRRALSRLAQEPAWPDAAALNALGTALGDVPRTASGHPIRFVPPACGGMNYELRIHARGEIATRACNWHDLFNALVWLAFPRTKARLNAIHASEIPIETTRRGPARDLLTIFDEGGALVACSDPELVELMRAFRWQTLFWTERTRVLESLRIVVFGHAVLEKALVPWPGITCKALLIPVEQPLLSVSMEQLCEVLDAAAAVWFDRQARGSTPRDLAPLPVFGYPGWSEGSTRAAFYADERYFRPQPHAVNASQG